MKISYRWRKNMVVQGQLPLAKHSDDLPASALPVLSPKTCTNDGTHEFWSRCPFWSRRGCRFGARSFINKMLEDMVFLKIDFCKRNQYRQKRLPGGRIHFTCPRSLSTRKTLLQTIFIFVLRWLRYPFKRRFSARISDCIHWVLHCFSSSAR